MIEAGIISRIMQLSFEQMQISIKSGCYIILEVVEILYSIFVCWIPYKPENPENADIIVIPGFFTGPFFYRKLCRNFQDAGLKVAIVPLHPFQFSITKKINLISDYLKRVSKKQTVIAHNTAGFYAMVLPDEPRQKIKKLITLGTPFQGSLVFSFFPSFLHESQWKKESGYLESIKHNSLLLDYFHPFSAIKDYTFFPNGSSVFGQGRDWWFDIPGNYNLVRRKENIRTLIEFVKDGVSLPAPETKEILGRDRVPTVEQKGLIKKRTIKQVKVAKKKTSASKQKNNLRQKSKKLKRKTK